jgi:Domain of unknown function (DUF1850).
MSIFLLVGGNIFPPGFLSRKICISKFILLFLITFCFYLVQPDTVFASSNDDKILYLKNSTGQILFSIPVKNDQYFILQYIHSVALSPVEDYFKICNDKIVLDKTIYKDFGAGLPHMPVGNQKMTVNNGQVEITGYNMEFNSFDVRVGRVAKHKFILLKPATSNIQGNQLVDIPLDYLSKPGSAVTFSIVK